MILVCIDTVRGDSIEAVGGTDGEPPAMPSLAALAARSTHFADASASAAWTAPSVSTLLTGLYPSQHGCHGPVGNVPRLSSDVATLAEYLRAEGYSTAGYTGGAFVSEETNLAQGFDDFAPTWSFSDPSERLERWIREHDARRPFFLFLHTYDAHDPYGDKPPRPTKEQVEASKAFVAELRPHVEAHKKFPPERMRDVMLAHRSDPLTSHHLSLAFERQKVVAAVVDYDRDTYPTAPDRAETTALLRARYRDGLRRTDTLLQGVLDRLGAAVPPNTVLVVATDHGEAFGEHDNLGHGRWLHDELVRAVLVVHAPGRMPVGRVRGSCGLVDVVPTVLDLVGMPVPSDLDGRSLVALASGRDAGRAVIGEEHRMLREEDSRVHTRLVSARTERAKWIATWDPKTDDVAEAVYDLEADPGETTALPASEAARFGAPFEEGVRTGRAMAQKLRRAHDGSGK